ncbi:MAG: WhiB family transcriptional regulator [Pseudonocardia sp.]|nr:WhiB family transcriptional regulator [Pseudonocardia sp.]
MAAAKTVCRGCAVLTECREWALLHLPHGVAGGLSETERSAIRRRQRRATPSAALSGAGGDVAPTATRRERRAAAVRCVDEGRTSRDQAARQFRVSTRTIDRWLAAARASA